MPNSLTDQMLDQRRRNAAIWLTLCLSIIIAALTLIPLNIPKGVLGTDKFHHMVAFATLTLPCAAFYPKALFKVMLAAALYGGAIEIIQPAVGRSSELADFIADLLGVCVGATLGIFLNIAFKSRISRRLVRI